jgi:acetyltransferase
MAALLPPAAALQNPVDMLGNATHETYVGCLRLLLEDPGVDGIILIIVPPPLEPAEAVAEAVIPLIRASSKPVLVALMGGGMIRKTIEVFHRAQIPEYRFPERAIAAMAALARRAEFLERPEESPRRWPEVDPQAAQAALSESRSGAFLDPESTDRLMGAYGIPIAAVRLARTAKEAAKIAGQLGFPVALKVDSADIPHKSDVGGVLLDIRTPEEASVGFRTVTRRARRAVPGARIAGVQLQCMLPEGQEVIVGAARDPQFGALMMFGSGGVEVEGLKDVAFALAPLPPSEADGLIRRTWAGRKLSGYRNIPPADAARVKEILQRLAQLAHDFPQIAEIEINPLRVMAEGAVGVDVRVRVVDKKG